MLPNIVGILNVTPDSFSDGGKFTDIETIHSAIASMIEDGADVIDIGPESTRPHATPLSPEEEWQRLSPVFKEVLPAFSNQPIAFSIDTRHPGTAARAVELGAHWINDVSGFAHPDMVEAVRGSGCTLVYMHSLSVPADPNITLREDEDAIAALLAFAYARAEALQAAGIAKERLIFDPGIGFSKTAAQSIDILKRIGDFNALGVPLLIGHSRKSFLKQFTDAPAAERDMATLAVSACLMHPPVAYLRVHNVRAHAELRRVWAALHG